jgi:transitional endoplasmic reticulum ATPase
MRPGRFDRLIYVPSPDFDSLKEIFKIHAISMPLLKDVSLDELARKAQGYSGADIEAICREAAMNALREDIDATEVSRRDFDAAMERIGPSIAPEDDAWYQKFIKRLRRERTAARTPVA